MSDGQIRIRISASQDAASFERAFGDLTKRAQRAGRDIQRALNPSQRTSGGAAGELTKSMRGAATAADKAARDVDRVWNRQLNQLNRVAKAQDQIFERSARAEVRAAEKAARARVQAETRANREIERAFAATSRANEREETKRTRTAERELNKQQRARETFASRVSHRATRFLFPPPMGILGAASRLAGGLLRGAGIDTSIQGGMGRAIALNSGAVGLSNQERITTGQTRGAGYYENLARNTGDKFSQRPEAVLDLVRSFTGKTGDFGAADKMSEQLTSISVASGADLNEMGDAAGYVYNQLKNIPGAAEKTIAVMRGIVGQTAVGAVEMKDYAKQMGRVAANAQSFEGDVSKNILKLSALTQLNIESGGATSAADAARGTVSFANTFGKGARLKQFEKAGVRVYTDDTVVNGRVVAGKERTTKRDPFELLKDSFRATKGNVPQLANMFADVLGRKPLMALGGAFKAAGGGEAGIAAVEKSFGRYMNAQLSPETEKKNLADYKNSPAAKAQAFQNNLDKIVATMATRVIPSLERLAPKALTLADALGKLIGYVTENPFKALSAALTLAIGRAFLEAKLRNSIERTAVNSGSGMLPGASGGTRLTGGVSVPGTGAAINGGGLGVFGNFVAALQIATAAVVAFQAGMVVIDAWIASKEKKQNADAIENANAGGLEGKFQASANNTKLARTPEEKAQLVAYQAKLAKRVQDAEAFKQEPASVNYGAMGNWAAPSAPKGGYTEDVQHLVALKAEMARNAHFLQMIQSGVMRVEVINQPHEGPSADGGSSTTGSP